MTAFSIASIDLPATALHWQFSLASGPGGQHVNKKSTAVELRVSIEDIPISIASRERLRNLAGSRRTSADDIVIVARNHRSQFKNRQEALQRLEKLISSATQAPKRRVPTKPTRASKIRRLDEKKKRGSLKQSRRPPKL